MRGQVLRTGWKLPGYWQNDARMRWIGLVDRQLLDTILPGDCIEVLADLPENSVDVVFADPPYNLQLQNQLYRPDNTRVEAVEDAWDKFSSFEDYDEFTRRWLAECRRVLKETGTIWIIGSYHNIFRVGKILQDLGYWILNDVIWIKNNPMPNFRGMRFTNAHETLIWAQKVKGAKYTFNHRAMKALNDDLQMRSDWYLPLCTGKERLRANGQKGHPTQKPEALLYRVILSSTNAGDLILDPFFGTGTTGAVAKRLQRHWIGIEQRPDYIELARQRMGDFKADLLVEDVFENQERRSQPRIPFGNLLEGGLLLPGQTLYFGPTSDTKAIILADGHIRANGFSGSIHQVGRMLLNAPCNGWEHWYYFDDLTGERQSIDTLRQKIRQDKGD
jgi:site-specific DNA-methyltransferase (adenine-specific)